MSPSGASSKRIVVIGAGQTGRALCGMLGSNWDIVVLDVSAAALEQLRAEVPAQRPLRLLPLDGTSLLNLREAGVTEAEWVVAVTQRDEANIEACRVALSVTPRPSVLGLVNTTAAVQQLKEMGAEALTRPGAIAGLLVNAVSHGVRVAVSVGLGRGEVVEIPVLPSSPAANVRVADLRARRWLVAAIYRGTEILVPHGDVVIRSGDRLLLSGEPDILPHIADFLRVGVARFPLQYGRKMVALGQPSLKDRYVDEVRYLCQHTRAAGLQLLLREKAPVPSWALNPWVPTTISTYGRSEGVAGFLEREGEDLDCGCLLLPKGPPGLLSRYGLVRPAFARLLELVPAPALLLSGSHPYKRIMLPVTDSQGTRLSADLAIDLARQLSLPITAVLVSPPAFVVGQATIEEQKKALQMVTEIAALYDLRPERLHVEGNPVTEIVRHIGPGDLLVVASKAGRRASFFSPDVSMLLIERAPCSVLALSYRERDDGAS